ncbi:MAG: dihydroneopterin aldolase [Elusimicrobia bacterium]|nr:dihydroneopterin aldolase [Elusimicrobiota bacterium]
MDRIWLYGIECRCRVGVPDSERKKPQRILIDVGMELDVSKAAARDDFRLTADYWAVEKSVRESAEAGERRLVETLAQKLAQVVLAKDKRIGAVTIVVRKKPAAMPKTREVAVELTRRRSPAA